MAHGEGTGSDGSRTSFGISFGLLALAGALAWFADQPVIEVVFLYRRALRSLAVRDDDTTENDAWRRINRMPGLEELRCHA